MTKPGAQAYYDSVFALLASWKVDFVKVDDLSRPYHEAEIEGIRQAIDSTGRKIVFSSSPGATPVSAGDHISTHANMWRISDDFWDSWPLLQAQFDRLRDWTPYRGPGHFPDADMLPLGVLQLGRANTHFTRDEQFTLLTLWSIARSPLIIGADLTKLDGFTRALLTNDEVIAVDQASADNHELLRREGFCVWVADIPNSPDKYLAVFNVRDHPTIGSQASEHGEFSATVPVALSELGFQRVKNIRNLWTHQDLGPVSDEFAPAIKFHGAGLYRLSP